MQRNVRSASSTPESALAGFANQVRHPTRETGKWRVSVPNSVKAPWLETDDVEGYLYLIALHP